MSEAQEATPATSVANTCYGLAYFSATMSFVFGVMTLFVIADMNRKKITKWTGFTLLVATLTVFQGMFDCLWFFIELQDTMKNFPEYNLFKVFICFVNIAPNLITNVLSYCIAYIVVFEKGFDIIKNFKNIMIFVVSLSFFPSLLVALAYLDVYGKGHKYSSQFNIFYASIVFLSLVFNIVAAIIVAYRLRELNKNREKFSTNNQKKSPLVELSRRMIPYPLVQSLTRFAFLWFTYQTGNAGLTAAISTAPKGELYTFFLFTPSAGVGFGLVFFILQPQAFSHLCSCLGLSKVLNIQAPSRKILDNSSLASSDNVDAENRARDSSRQVSMSEADCEEGEAPPTLQETYLKSANQNLDPRPPKPRTSKRRDLTDLDEDELVKKIEQDSRKPKSPKSDSEKSSSSASDPPFSLSRSSSAPASTAASVGGGGGGGLAQLSTISPLAPASFALEDSINSRAL